MEGALNRRAGGWNEKNSWFSGGERREGNEKPLGEIIEERLSVSWLIKEFYKTSSVALASSHISHEAIFMCVCVLCVCVCVCVCV